MILPKIPKLPVPSFHAILPKPLIADANMLPAFLSASLMALRTSLANLRTGPNTNLIPFHIPLAANLGMLIVFLAPLGNKLPHIVEAIFLSIMCVNFKIPANVLTAPEYVIPCPGIKNPPAV